MGMKVEYIVTRSHNQDYVSATAFMTLAEDRKEAIIACMRYDGALDGFLSDDTEDDENDTTLQAEISRLRSMPLSELEQVHRDRGDVWSAEPFAYPTLDKFNPVVQIAKLDTD